MLVTFGLPLSVWFLSDTWFIRLIPDFCPYIFMFVLHCASNLHGKFPIVCTQYVTNSCSCTMIGWGGRAGSHWWLFVLRECAREMILARSLLRQDKNQSRVPVRLPVPQGTGEASFAYYAGVQPHYYYWDPPVNPTTYVWNGFVKFLNHESTQIREYD